MENYLAARVLLGILRISRENPVNPIHKDVRTKKTHYMQQIYRAIIHRWYVLTVATKDFQLPNVICPSEAQEELAAMTCLNEQKSGGGSSTTDGDIFENEELDALQDQLYESAFEHRDKDKCHKMDIPWLNSSDESVGINSVGYDTKIYTEVMDAIAVAEKTK